MSGACWLSSLLAIVTGIGSAVVFKDLWLFASWDLVEESAVGYLSLFFFLSLALSMHGKFWLLLALRFLGMMLDSL